MGHEQVMDIVTPDGTGWIEIVVATVAYFLVSFLWWGPLLGKKWAGEMGISMDEKPEGMGKSMALAVIGAFLLSYVFWAVTHAFTATHDADGLILQNPAFMDVLAGALFTTLGFVIPMQLSRVSWEKASWTLFGINTGGHFVGLLVMGVIWMLL